MQKLEAEKKRREEAVMHVTASSNAEINALRDELQVLTLEELGIYSPLLNTCLLVLQGRTRFKESRLLYQQAENGTSA